MNDTTATIFGGIVSILTLVFGFLERRSAWRIKALEKDAADKESRLKKAEVQIAECHKERAAREEESRLLASALAEEKLAHVTESKTAEMREQRMRQQIEEILSIVVSGNREILESTIETDAEGKITKWDVAATYIFGWTEDEAVGRDAIILLPPSVKHVHLKAFRLWQASDCPPRTDPIIGSAVTKDGTEMKVSVTLSGWKDEGGWHLAARVKKLTEVAPSSGLSGVHKRPPTSPT